MNAFLIHMRLRERTGAYCADGVTLSAAQGSRRG
jgi:hypothetical protein